MGLADKMKAKYGMGEKESDHEEMAEGGEDAEGEKLGNKLNSAIKSGDGGMIYNAVSALVAHCNSKMGA